MHEIKRVAEESTSGREDGQRAPRGDKQAKPSLPAATSGESTRQRSIRSCAVTRNAAPYSASAHASNNLTALIAEKLTGPSHAFIVSGFQRAVAQCYFGGGGYDA
jgi:hypothetical protein